MKIDLHCHIDLYDDPFIVANKCEEQGIHTVAVSNTPSMYEEASLHLSKYRYVKTALGLHPTIKGSLKGHLSKFVQHINEAIYIGEIGLDGTVSQDLQMEREEVFERILNEMSLTNHIMTVHSRRMEEKVIKMVNQYLQNKIVFHWYSGSIRTAEKIVESGHYFSVNLVMLKNISAKKTIAIVPRDRILTESDGPFAKYQGTPLTPLNLDTTLSELGKLWGVSTLEAENTVYDNFTRLAKDNHLEIANFV